MAAAVVPARPSGQQGMEMDDSSSSSRLQFRSADTSDLESVIGLAKQSLGWRDGDPNEAFFRWKHFENPFGVSPMWIAVEAERIVGLRTFLRWRWRLGDAVIESVRAVDTATHPDFQGQGIFTALTKRGVDELCGDGVSFVYNTPNDKSRPGYLKMGWVDIGRVPVSISPIRLAPVRVLRSLRAPAEKWSAGFLPAEEPARALADSDALGSLLRSLPRTEVMVTDTSVEFLRWRYGFGPLGYRVLRYGSSISEGFVAFRVRKRGKASELAICDVVVPGDDPSIRRRLIRDVVDIADADYCVQIPSLGQRSRMAKWVPSLGPMLTWRALASDNQPSLAKWKLTLADIELF